MNICLISLGCDKNLVDSEVMLGIMTERGYAYTDDMKNADIAIVNTCCFILDAKDESVQAILEAARYKHEGKLKALIVTGCMAQRYQGEITKELPEVDAILGTSSFDKIGEVIDKIIFKQSGEELFLDLNRLPAITSKRRNATGGWYAYLKIAEGCDKHCTYCIIPSLRGNFRSYPMEELIKQARCMAAAGIKELILVAQETTLYGVDIYGNKKLADLLHKLCEIDGIRWIRILYAYPEEIDDVLIEAMAGEDKVCKYLDMPIQHASDRILGLMGRRTTKAELIELIGKLRKKIPNIILRTTLITGFPGETEQDVEELLDFVRKMRFERLGVFCYSKEEHTPAANFANQVDEEDKADRRDRIMRLQQDISMEHLKSMIGREMDVMIEGSLPEEDIYIGRTCMDMPNVDGYIFVKSQYTHMSGDFVRVLVTGSSEYDLIGDII